jgi:hypothetical protein
MSAQSMWSEPLGIDEYHVLPIDDLREHSVSSNCWCDPDCGDGVFVHHALDQRETYENGRPKQ